MKKGLILLLSVVLMVACKNKNVAPEGGGKSISIEIKRFEQDLFRIDPAKIQEIIPNLNTEYNRFFQIFNYRIIQIGNPMDNLYAERLKQFITDYNMYKLFERCDSVFNDLSWLERDFEESFKTYSMYFPEREIPKIYTFISGFNQSVVSDSNLLGIGLDKYLGQEEELYNQLGVYNYLRVNMHKNKILPDAIRLWGLTEFEFNDSINNLISNMVYEGANMYFTNQILTDCPDTLLWGFTHKQLDFCTHNEKQMWTYLIENKMLFNSDKFTINKFTSEGPFTKDFSTASPARAAVWLGYNIVKSYVNKNNISLTELMNERNYMKILNLSGYNP
ncbi:MAG: hypothetical protein HC906_06395 [Bacteroidales bacterium]|nr:hypothetical protein [Bacteroidales bacterium]